MPHTQNYVLNRLRLLKIQIWKHPLPVSAKRHVWKNRLLFQQWPILTTLFAHSHAYIQVYLNIIYLFIYLFPLCHATSNYYFAMITFPVSILQFINWKKLLCFIANTKYLSESEALDNKLPTSWCIKMTSYGA